MEVKFERPDAQMIRTDPTRLRQVLINLIANAIKFTKEGGVALIRLDQALLLAVNPLSEVKIADTGIGIPPERQAAALPAVRSGRRHHHSRNSAAPAWGWRSPSISPAPWAATSPSPSYPRPGQHVHRHRRRPVRSTASRFRTIQRPPWNALGKLRRPGCGSAARFWLPRTASTIRPSSPPGSRDRLGTRYRPQRPDRL